MNRLGASTSPYLLQHADNPVDWWPWCPEAFAEARDRDVPVLLSVGYAACHWCHVMAHESFEDEATADLMNERFVCIKVDREERPDVDSVYLTATQAMTGSAGWPMTVFATPDGAPFYCGTYFPDRPRNGTPSFGQLMLAISDAWRDRRADLVRSGRSVVEALGSMVAPGRGGPAVLLDPDLLDLAADRIAASFDAGHGGFGGAPKFPPSMVLEFLLRRHARTGDPSTLHIVEQTCERMARGGIYDQLAGGFARYSVDAGWVVPHFEKMLYDNALLARVYLHLWRATGAPLARRVVIETVDFCLRDLGTTEGGFASALDADTDGVEGLTYAWTPAELVRLLGEADGRWAAGVLGVTEEGTFEHGTSTLQLPADPPDPARWRSVRATLLDARVRRPQPGRDDKVVTAWNGLMIAALAEAGALLGVPGYVAAAVRGAEMVLRTHLVDGRLRRTSRDGVVGVPAGVLEDYANLAEALLVLHQVTGEPRWLVAAGDLLATVQARFASDDGGFFDTADDAERLIARPADPTDNATPAGTSAAGQALLTYAALTGSTRHREAAERALASVGPLAARDPRFAGWALAAAEAAVAGPLQVAVVGPGPDLLAAARLGTSPGLVVVPGEPDAPGVPLLADRGLVRGLPAAYVCHGFVCDTPVTEPAAVAAAVRAVRWRPAEG
ncbi:MAG: thioredoxin domain-containing protein [Actinobacteria bacterium]|nr:thioredoxin domain-containing protein [Actinomycetota bacterium]MBI3685863.1 thioredoxin domain-containing protein [Actinomycetota bacterium]